jgi:hypothetical protein
MRAAVKAADSLRKLGKQLSYASGTDAGPPWQRKPHGKRPDLAGE